MPAVSVVTPPAAFRENGVAPQADARPAAEAAGPWWQVFGDAGLDAWVQRARRDNPGLAQAAARVARAAAALGVQAARASPQLAANIAASRQIGALVNAAGGQGNLFDAGLRLSWDADALQRLSRQQQAALHDLQSQQRMHQQAQLVLEAEVVLTYLAWRDLGAEQQALAAVVQIDRVVVAVAERRIGAGLAAATARSAALAELGNDEVEVQAFERRRAQLEHALFALAGGDGEAFVPAEASAAHAALPVIPAGLPSTMLQRRGDVAAAEQTLQAARLRLGLARDAWFPALTLTASAGVASGELGQWLRAAARSAGFGLLLSIPGLDGGRADAERLGAEAALAEATAVHRDKVVQALREVDDQLSALRTLAAEAAARRRVADEAARDAVRLTHLWQSGLLGEVEVMQARRVAERQHRLWLQLQAARRQATVALVRALGGGWGTTTASPLADASVATDGQQAP